MSVHIIAWYNMGNGDFIGHTNLSMSQFTILLFLIWSEQFLRLSHGHLFPNVPMNKPIWPCVDPVSEGDRVSGPSPPPTWKITSIVDLKVSF